LKKLLKNKTALIIGNGSRLVKTIAGEFSDHGAQVAIGTYEIGKKKIKSSPVLEDINYKNSQTEKFNETDIFDYIKKSIKSLDVFVNDLSSILDPDLNRKRPNDYFGNHDLSLERVCCYINKSSEMMADNDKGGSIITILPTFSNLEFKDEEKIIIFRSALASLSKHWSLNFGKKNIRVNAVSPGYIKDENFIQDSMKGQLDEIVYLKRLGSIKEVVNVVTFLASEDANYVTGNVIKVDGGRIS
tara:strand:- start:5590 stop:6321 length:732 start_codon:yes stop_codon:yes gene_type:complete